MVNNHPLLGICCHHRLHPLKIGQRVVCLIGSIAFGLSATNFVFLYYALSSERSMEDTVFKLEIASNTTDIHPMFQSIEITSGMVSLWTFGGLLHSFFDLTIWHVAACACCLPGGMCAMCGCCKKLGRYIVVGVVVVMAALATFVVLWRASRQDYLEAIGSAGIDDDENIYIPRFSEIDGINNFSFLLGYCVELALALFVYYPFVGTILFSGVLGCGRLPILGGRPREVRLELQKKRRREMKSNRTTESRTRATQDTSMNDTLCTNTTSDQDAFDDEDWAVP